MHPPMPHPSVIASGALLHSAAFGMMAIAATTRGHAIVLVDARVATAADGTRCIAARFRNQGGAPIAALWIDVLLLDRHGGALAQSRTRIEPLPAQACCDIRSDTLPPTTARFRFRQAANPVFDGPHDARIRRMAFHDVVDVARRSPRLR